MLTTITNLPNTIVTADVNTHSPLLYLPTKDHKGELIDDILLNSNHITLNTNTPTRLSPNQTQQLTSPDITTASADLHYCISWQTIHSLTFDYLPLLTTFNMHHKTKTTHSHFTKTITNYQKPDWTLFKQHIENLISHRPHKHKHLIKAILDADRLFIPTTNHNSSNHSHLPMHICKLIYHCNHIHKQNKSDPQITILNNEDKTNTWKQH